MAKEADTVLFLERNRITIYDANSILKLDVPPAVTKDMEIVDKGGFDSLLENFIKSKKLDPGLLWVVLSDEICFSHDVSEADASKLEAEVRDFLETVPFEQVISKRFKSQTGVRVIAANLEMVEAATDIFERNGFVIEAITPAAIFPGFAAKKALDPASARFIISNKNIARQGNMLARINPPRPASPAPQENNKSKNKLLPYLLVGFFVLLVILVAALLLRR